MTIARLKIRVREKATGRTWLAYWPPQDGIALCARTGEMRVVPPGQSGFTEYNDRGAPVTDSWVHA